MARRPSKALRTGIATFLALLTISAVTALSPTAAQTPAQDEQGGRLTIIDARLTGDGPWTSWLGAAAERRLLLTVENTGATLIADPVLVLRSGKGDPTTEIDAPSIGRLEPGERATMQVDVDLPAFAFGTHAVVGEFPDFGEPTRFRAETTHVPWLLLLLPTLILGQVVLVALRNRARRAIERPERADTVTEADVGLDESPPADESETEIDLREDQFERVIRHELDMALADLRDQPMSDEVFIDALYRRATTATDRVARHLQIDRNDRPALAVTITEALLARIEAEQLTAD